MKYDEKEFLDLLQEYKSDETKKARRNLSVISFIIACASILGVRFTELKIFNADISKAPELLVLFLGFLLVVYWTTMFLLSWTHDKEIQKERSLLLNTQIKYFTDRYRAQEKKRESNPNFISSDYPEVKAAVEAYEAQQARTKRAAKYGNIVNKLELFVPLALSVLAAVALVKEAACVL